jgi:hypothetical protein
MVQKSPEGPNLVGIAIYGVQPIYVPKIVEY